MHRLRRVDSFNEIGGKMKRTIIGILAGILIAAASIAAIERHKYNSEQRIVGWIIFSVCDQPYGVTVTFGDGTTLGLTAAQINANKAQQDILTRSGVKPYRANASFPPHKCAMLRSAALKAVQ